MRRKPLLIGAAVVVVVAGVIGVVALRGGDDKALEVQTAKVDRQKIVREKFLWSADWQLLLPANRVQL